MFDYLSHCRYRFVGILVPIFLWGAAMSGRPPTLESLLAFLAFHVFLYAGANAYNSACDRDAGPIGGLRHPPPLPPHLARVGLILKVVGLTLAVPGGMWVAGIYVAFALLSIGYSHPALRWKASPGLSLCIVTAGQGGMPFVAGWCSAPSSGFGTWDVADTLAVVGTGVLTAGIYPLSQVYQLDADRAAGFRTWAGLLGTRQTVSAFRGAFSIGIICLGAAAGLRFGGTDATLVLTYGGVCLAATRRLEQGALAGVRGYDRIMPVLYANSTLFTLYGVVRLALNGGGL